MAPFSQVLEPPPNPGRFKNASWVGITTNAQDKMVYYDPYRLKWVSSNLFTVPASYPMSSGNYGAWVLELSCNNNSSRVLRTLGAKYDTPSQSTQYAATTVLASIRDRVCGVSVGAKNYAFVGPDKDWNIYFYDQNSLARYVKNPSVYRFDWILFDPRTKKTLVNKTSEVNCGNNTIKLDSEKPWQKTAVMSTEDIFIARFCPTITTRKLNISSYSGSVEDIDVKDYLKKLNSDNKPRQPTKPKATDTQTSGKPGFEWDKLVIHPKD